LLNDEESDRVNLEDGRADLALTGSATPVVDGGADVTVELVLLDRNGVLDPTVTFDLPSGVAVPAPPEGCELAGQELTCVPVGYYDLYPPLIDGPPVPPLELTVGFEVEEGVTDPIITATATSWYNGLDNDPDPSNNVVHLTLVTETPAALPTAPVETTTSIPAVRDGSTTTSTALAGDAPAKTTNPSGTGP
jgi:hypothetical protein